MAVITYSWEGDRRSGIAMAVRYRHADGAAFSKVPRKILGKLLILLLLLQYYTVSYYFAEQN